jgi:hypothetical protein
MEQSALLTASILIGALVLLFGRRLFWLFVAGIGFWIGFELAPYLMQNPPPWLALVVAIIFGIVGAVLAFVLQKIAIGIAGFLVGGYVATAILGAFVTASAQYHGIAFIIGGVLGAILMLMLFDWALIVFSAIAGSELIVRHLHLPATGKTLILIVLVILGIIVQTAMFARRRAL